MGSAAVCIFQDMNIVMRRTTLALRRRTPAVGLGRSVLPRAAVTRTLSTATADGAASAAPASTLLKSGKLVAELERLEQLPWWQSSLLRLGGTFGDEQWQAAAGGDMYLCLLEQSDHSMFMDDKAAGLPDRFYTHLQLRGLHAWAAHVRLRAEPKERFSTLFREMMEHVWDQASLDLSRQFGMGYIEISKHLKASQWSWHGFCKNLDAALESEDPREEMTAIIIKNMYVDEDGDPLVDETGAVLTEAEAGARWVVEYLLSQRAHLAALPAEDVLKGRLSWAPPPPSRE